MAKKKNVIEEVVETVETVVEETVAPEPEVKPVVTGLVTNCSKLNIRKKPNAKAEIIKVVNAKTQVVIDEEASTKDWYKVTVSGVNGFCMKSFIAR